LNERYAWTPLCRIVLTLEGLTAAIGPAGDVLQVPMRITGGYATVSEKRLRVLSGTDFAAMYADEQLVHNGNFVLADPAGDVVVWYDGPSQAAAGAYDDLLDGRLPATSPTRLSVRTISTGPGWATLNRRPLIGVGLFDGAAGTLAFTLLSIAASPTANG
jgi:hypothetical protein